MDLVKNHLMSAVRGEVEDLKEKIVRLEEHMARIQIENQILREHVPSEVKDESTLSHTQLKFYTRIFHYSCRTMRRRG